jgi:hypothetical protein
VPVFSCLCENWGLSKTVGVNVSIGSFNKKLVWRNKARAPAEGGAVWPTIQPLRVSRYPPVPVLPKPFSISMPDWSRDEVSETCPFGVSLSTSMGSNCAR